MTDKEPYYLVLTKNASTQFQALFPSDASAPPSTYMRVLWAALHDDTCRFLARSGTAGGYVLASFALVIKDLPVRALIEFTDRPAPDGVKSLAFVRRLERYDGHRVVQVHEPVEKGDLVTPDGWRVSTRVGRLSVPEAPADA